MAISALKTAYRKEALLLPTMRERSDMKKYAIVFIAIMLALAVLFVFADRGSLRVENKSGQPIEQISISVGGNVVLEKSDFADGESVAPAFAVRRGDQIEIELKLSDSCFSRGSIDAGFFANIRVTVDAEGDLNFGKTRFEHSNVKIGSW